ncbi:MAG TPA: toxic anion resistance protein [Bdellovibrionota bacterium]|nr:toxic anion resistance protein [Bdellovibrionota bacterium]
MTRESKNAEKSLVPATAAELKKDLALTDPTDIHADPAEDRPLEQKAQAFVDGLFEIDPAARDRVDEGKAAVEGMAAKLQKEASRQSDMLKKPMSQLAGRSEEGGQVAKSLIALKQQVEVLNPNTVDFSPGWFSRALGKLPGVGSPLSRYFSRFESAQTVIAAIVRSLEEGRDQLGRDNVTLSEDQKRMHETAAKLGKAIRLGQLIDQKLQYKLDRETEPGTPKHKFVAEELLFPLRQRVMDLQQQLAVSQQGILATELIIRNNKELVRGVNRALNVTVGALQVAVTVALALENQKLVLDKLTSVNRTTSDLIAGTASRLKTQGVEIHKQAASTTLDMNSLKQAFTDVQAALDDLSSFRMHALPQMAQAVLDLDRLNTDVKKSIDRIESGKKLEVQSKLQIEVE